jgi:LacI family transcriptional regulator
LISRPDGPPDAIFAASDTMARGILRALSSAGIRVPDDIALIGFDNLAESATTQPPLSTVEQPITDYGREAVRMLIARIENPDRAPEQIFLPTRLVRRRSCGCTAVSLDEVTGGAAVAAVPVNVS